MKSFLIVIGVVLIGGVAYWLISPNFITTRVEDSLPTTQTPDGGVETPRERISTSVPVVGTPGHDASGGVRIIETADGSRELYFENFTTVNGPDLYVYLAKDLDAEEFISLGRLRGTEGNIRYTIPEGVDIDEYRYALTWCQAFSVLFNSADLSTITFGASSGDVCIQVITPARNSSTGEIREFPTPCAVPVGWEVIENDVPELDLPLETI